MSRNKHPAISSQSIPVSKDLQKPSFVVFTLKDLKLTSCACVPDFLKPKFLQGATILHKLNNDRIQHNKTIAKHSQRSDHKTLNIRQQFYCRPWICNQITVRLTDLTSSSALTVSYMYLQFDRVFDKSWFEGAPTDS